MSGGSMDWLYLRVRDADFKLNSPERVAFRHHLMLVAKALQSIEWNDSGDGDDQEAPNIMACIALSAEENKLLRAEIERLLQAIGLATTAVPDMVVDVTDPLGMMQRVVAEVDRQRAEIEKLRAERDALRGAAREYLETLGGAMKSGKFEMGGSAEMAHFVRQAMQRLDSLVFDRAGPRPAGLEKLHEPHGRAS